MTPLRLIQKRFALAVLDHGRNPPKELCDGSGRFGVYRNNVQETLTRALATRFPVCRQLVGEVFFRGMARVFVELSPPRSPVLMTYGDELPVFLELFPPARTVPYLADVVRLEIARSQAYHAAEAEPLSAADLGAVSPRIWNRAKLRLHPSLRLVASLYPIVSIWAAHTDKAALPELSASKPEDALVARPGAMVEISRLPRGGAAFVEDLLRHGCLQSAMRASAAKRPGLDLVRCLTVLMDARVILGVDTTPEVCA